MTQHPAISVTASPGKGERANRRHGQLDRAHLVVDPVQASATDTAENTACWGCGVPAAAEARQIDSRLLEA
jgi:hypothetical protein